MGRLAGLAAVVVIASACAVGASQGSLAARSSSPSPPQATASSSPAESSPSPSPLAPGSPIVEVNPANYLNLRAYVYDLKAGSSRMLIDKARSQVLFIKDGWVWYAEEGGCASDAGCPGGTGPTGKMLAMQLSGGSETQLSFSAGESPLIQRENWLDWTSLAAGDFWPGT